MSTLSSITLIVQELAEAGREVGKVDALRIEHASDPIWNRMMDTATARLARAVATYDAMERWADTIHSDSRLNAPAPAPSSGGGL